METSFVIVCGVPLLKMHLSQAATHLSGVHCAQDAFDIVDDSGYPYVRSCPKRGRYRSGSVAQMVFSFVSLVHRQDRPGAIKIRFVLFCDALQYYGTTGNSATPIYASPWRATTINLSKELGWTCERLSQRFNVIENLMNHVGCFHSS